jgi:alpha-D-ribose 1-methylphosphonate 5-triphosphate synthase subunit PhnH
MNASFEPGFADPVRDAQRTFRLMLEAMSRPGRVVEAGASVRVNGIGPAAGAVALALCDLETPVWLDPDTAAAAPWLRFHCGAPIVAAAGDGRFAFIRRPEAMPSLDAFALGSDEYPDRSATLVIEVAGLRSGAGLALSGPGIDGMVRLTVDGIGAGFWRERAEFAELFPRGLDLVFTCGERLAALPRTTIVRE